MSNSAASAFTVLACAVLWLAYLLGNADGLNDCVELGVGHTAAHKVIECKERK